MLLGGVLMPLGIASGTLSTNLGLPVLVLITVLQDLLIGSIVGSRDAQAMV